jgi:hypothetical protein
MTGGALLRLILLSMGWLFFLAGLAVHCRMLMSSLKAARRERPSSLSFLPGVVGSVTALFTFNTLAGYGVEVAWPWLWILLPLVIDPYCVGGLLFLVRR